MEPHNHFSSKQLVLSDLKSINLPFNKINESKKQTQSNLSNEFPKKTFTYKFQTNIEKLYLLFIEPSFFPNIYYNKSKIISMKNNTTITEEGNEFEIINFNGYKIKMKVIKSINNIYYKSFTHDLIEKPPLLAGFYATYNFYFDSIENVSILQIEIITKDNLYKTSIADYMDEHKNQKYKIIGDYLKENINNIEQEESISINKNINFIWNFFLDYNNIKYFFNFNLEIGMLYDKENEIEIIDKEKNNKIKFMINLNENKENENEKEILLQIISSIIPILKQRIIIKMIKIKNFNTMIIFKHEIMEYLDYNVIKSYSFVKKKSLWDIKSLLEKDTS